MAANPVSSLIPPINPVQLPETPGTAPISDRRFADTLSEAIGRVEAYRAEAHNSVDSFLAGDSEDLHEVALKTQRAELSFEMFLQVRNKVVQAYQEVMRMQV